MGFIKLNQKYQVILDSYHAIQTGTPIIWGKGFIELPNILVLGMGLVGEIEKAEGIMSHNLSEKMKK